MDQLDIIPGTRVEVDNVGEGTVVKNQEDEVEVAVSEVETVRVHADRVKEME
jgi:hypothetical protein